MILCLLDVIHDGKLSDADDLRLSGILHFVALIKTLISSLSKSPWNRRVFKMAWKRTLSPGASVLRRSRGVPHTATLQKALEIKDYLHACGSKEKPSGTQGFDLFFILSVRF